MINKTKSPKINLTGILQAYLSIKNYFYSNKKILPKELAVQGYNDLFCS